MTTRNLTTILTGAVLVAPAVQISASAKSAKKPNVIFIVTDQQSYDAIGAYKKLFPRTNVDFDTPNFDRLVNEGISFTSAYCANSVSMPSRFAMFTGLFGSSYNVRHNGYDGVDNQGIREILPEYGMGNIFKRGGYDTYYGGKIHLPCGSADVEENSFYSAPVTYGFDEYYTGDEREKVSDIAAEILDERAKSPEKPFLLVASFINPHDICMEAAIGLDEVPAKGPNAKKEERMNSIRIVRNRAEDIGSKSFYDKYAPQLPDNFSPTEGLPENIRLKTEKYPEEYWRRYRWVYSELVTLVDSHIGVILDALDRNPELKKNTYIVFTSDHGEQLGAHQRTGKGLPYDESQRVPFIITGPKVKSGDIEIGTVSSGVDVIPTMCGLAGIDCPKMDGVSLAKRVVSKGSIPQRDGVVSEANNFYTIVDGADKYTYYDRIKNGKDIKQLSEKNEMFVNLNKDPQELHNIYDSNKQRAAELKASIKQLQ